MSKKYKQVKINLDENVHTKLSLLAKDNGVTLAEMFRQSMDVNFEKFRNPTDKREHKRVNPDL